MFKIKKFLKNILFTANSFIYLKVVTLKRTIFLVTLSLLVMLFDTLSVLSIMPLLQYLDSNQNVENFIEATDYGKHLVYFFNVLNIQFDQFLFVCFLLLDKQ